MSHIKKKNPHRYFVVINTRLVEMKSYLNSSYYYYYFDEQLMRRMGIKFFFDSTAFYRKFDFQKRIHYGTDVFLFFGLSPKDV